MRNRLLPLTLRLAACVVASIAAARPLPAIPPAFGPYTNLTARDFTGVPSFSTNDRIVGTYYFYWYDAPTQFHEDSRSRPLKGSSRMTIFFSCRNTPARASFRFIPLE